MRERSAKKNKPRGEEMNKKESKYFATATKMDEALIKLLGKKEFEYITIRELCDRAGVNRSTFYLHYDNMTDLLQETTRYVFDKFLTYFSAPNIDYAKCGLEELIFTRKEYVIPYLTFIKENQRIFKTALNNLGTMGFEAYYNRMFSHIFNPILERFGVAVCERQYVIKYYLSGITAISLEWLDGGCETPIDTIYEIIFKCTIGLYGAFENED